MYCIWYDNKIYTLHCLHMLFHQMFRMIYCLLNSPQTAAEACNKNIPVDTTEGNLNQPQQKQLDGERPTGSDLRERRSLCLFRLDVGNRKGKKIKLDELSDNGKTVVLNSKTYFSWRLCACVMTTYTVRTCTYTVYNDATVQVPVFCSKQGLHNSIPYVCWSVILAYNLLE